MTPVKRIFAGIAGAAVLAGGGTIAADKAIDPYTVEDSALTITDVSTLPEAGTQKVILDTTKPKMTLEKWNGEVAMSVTYDGMQATGARPFLSKNVEWKQGSQTMQVVPLESSSTMEDGGYEINIILNSKPASNIFNFSIEGADQLDFFYQAPLWQEVGLKASMRNCTETDCITSEGISHRPENVVGSYAVYYKDHANHIEGQTNYATGKAYHIFRPLVTDGQGASVWADLSYANGLLTVTVPQSFLNTATFPIKVDPTFGYSTIGGTSIDFTSSSNNIGSIQNNYTAGTGDTVTDVNVYGDCGAAIGGTQNVDMAIYTVSAAKPNTKTGASQTVNLNSSTAQWWTVSSLSISLTSGTTYTIAFGNENTNNCKSLTVAGTFFRDVTSGVQNSQAGGGALLATWTETANSASKYSVYATYTASGGAATTNHAQVYLNKASGYINQSAVYAN